MSLQPLPNTQWLSAGVGHTEESLQAYGQACREQAIEEVISAIEAANARRVIYLPDVIEIIRSLK